MFGKRSSSAPDGTVKVADAAVQHVQSAPALQPALEPTPQPAPKPANVVEGGRSPIPSVGLGAPLVTAPAAGRQTSGMPPQQPLAPTATDSRHTDAYYDTKGAIFGALIEAIDLGQLAKLDADSAREEIRDIINEINAIKNIVMSISEQEELLDDICNDVLGYGPLEPLLARDDIADIMVNGSGTTFIEVVCGKGRVRRRF